MLAAPSALWCVKHRGRAVALVTGADRNAAAINAGPLISDMDEDDLRIAAVGDARPDAGPVVMDLRPPRPKVTPRTTASRDAETATRRAARDAKDAPFAEVASMAWRAACEAVGCQRGTFAPTDRSPATAACRLGFWRAAYFYDLSARVIAKATGSNPQSVVNRLRESSAWMTSAQQVTATLAEAAAIKVFAAHVARTC